MDLPKATTIFKFVGAFIAVVIPLFSAWFFIDNRHAHQNTLLEMNRQLQIRDNVNYLEIEVKIIEHEVERVNDVITMYQNRELINGTLDAADKRRVESLTDDLEDAIDRLGSLQEARDAMRLQINEPVQ